MIRSAKDLWIGDLLQLKKSGKVGKFAGLRSDGKLRIKVNEKIIITTLSNVDIYIEKEEKEIILFDDMPPITSSPKPPNNTIDLHVNVLAPHLEGQPASRILDYQMEAFHSFVKSSYKRRMVSVLIIHGKGEGVLRTEIQYHLKSDERVKFIFDRNDGGATEVFFNH